MDHSLCYEKNSWIFVIYENYEIKPTTKIFMYTVHRLNDYDPRPSEFKGLACGELPEILKKIKGNNLGISLLLDSEYIESQSTLLQPSGYNLPADGELKRTIDLFKRSLEVTQDQARQMERDTRDQRMSSTWFAIRQYRLTASMFGDVISRRPETPPD